MQQRRPILAAGWMSMPVLRWAWAAIIRASMRAPWPSSACATRCAAMA
jgi:hypothetical protein